MIYQFQHADWRHLSFGVLVSSSLHLVMWYFRSSADDAPTWIPAADLTELADPAASACDVGVHERVAASALPVIASGLGFVGAACATASTAFRATFVPRSRAGSRRSRAVESG
ncbi:MAG: hypothetical protein GXY65_13930 [Rhodococcus sp.]|uniref:hypothetical protein n=1 Tax=Rhodococcus TaxID=1827 RepID=UPI0016A7DB33|nr:MULTISPECIES: hypothetical protein [Rhodococcus]NLV80410.1 hypothetical protein [Rhodococcus sp. (in: high G+C Gram-positive bacteria)]